MPSPRPYPWSKEAILQRLRELAADRMPNLDTSANSLAGTLFQASSEMLSAGSERLNRVPDKLFLQFLNFAGQTLNIPAPARTALQFTTRGKLTQDPVIPARYQASTRPLGESGESLIFETLQDLTAMAPSLSSVVYMDTARDSYTGMAEFIEPKDHALRPLAVGDTERTYHIHITHPLFDVFSPESAYSMVLRLSFDNRVSPFQPYKYDESLVMPWDSAAHGPIYPILEGVEALGSDLSAGQYMYRAILGFENPKKMPLKIEFNTVDNWMSPNAILNPENEPSIFAPGRRKGWFSICFTGESPLIWKLTDHSVKAHVKDAMDSVYSDDGLRAFLQTLDVDISFMSESGEQFIQLGKSDIVPAHELELISGAGLTDDLRDTSSAYYHLGMLNHSPVSRTVEGYDHNKSEWLSKEGKYLTLRIRQKAPQTFSVFNHEIPHLKSIDFALNKRAAVSLDTVNPTRWILSDVTNLDMAFFNQEKLDLTGSFFPLGETPKFNDCFYMASSFFSRRLAICAIHFWLHGDMSQAPAFKEENDPSLKPPFNSDIKLAWEYFDGNDWAVMFYVRLWGRKRKFEQIPGVLNINEFEDTSRCFTRSSHKILAGIEEQSRGPVWFKVPGNIRPTTVNGHKNWWVRVRVTGGAYHSQDGGEKGQVPPMFRTFSLDFAGEVQHLEVGKTEGIQKVVDHPSEPWWKSTVSDDEIQKIVSKLNLFEYNNTKLPEWVYQHSFFFDDFSVTEEIQKTTFDVGEDNEWQKVASGPPGQEIHTIRKVTEGNTGWNPYWNISIQNRFQLEGGARAPLMGGLIRSKSGHDAFEAEAGVLQGDFFIEFGLASEETQGGLRINYPGNHAIQAGLISDNHLALEIRGCAGGQYVLMYDTCRNDVFVRLIRKGALLTAECTVKKTEDGLPDWSLEYLSKKELKLNDFFPAGKARFSLYQESSP